MNRRQIEERLDELEMSLRGDETDDETRADVLDEIAELEGQLEDCNAIAGATHIDAEGNYWSIAWPEYADGTGEVWTEDGWRTSEISDRFVTTLRAL